MELYGMCMQYIEKRKSRRHCSMTHVSKRGPKERDIEYMQYKSI